MSSDHTPIGDPCVKCGGFADTHRVEHKPVGNPCVKCGLFEGNHRPPREARGPRGDSYYERKAILRLKSDVTRPIMLRHNERSKEARKEREERDTLYLGLDGEGQGEHFHRYVLLACAGELGEAYTVKNVDGITTKQALDFLLNLPIAGRRVKIFGYSLNYDWTKILTDLDNESLYLLFRPELRQRYGLEAKKGPWPVRWNGYKLNLQGTKFTVSRGPIRRVIWDLFKFYQSKFVSALEAWGVGTPESRKHMNMMKDKRSEFDKVDQTEVERYCIQECRYMAELARKLIEAHDDAGLKLKSYYGAGSSGAAILEKMNIRQQMKVPDEGMREGIAAAFFGGRFENSRIGLVREIVYNQDISSAYPYHLTFLPCLLHGTWEHTTKRERLDRHSLVHYALEYRKETTAWAPFPFREKDGSICFPNGSGGGWVWGEEYLAGERLFPGVQFREAWVYRNNCDCQPFARMPHFYRERCRIGKEGAGIVLKLGPNSVYGKLAQSVGSALYQSWIWAGMITSGCRAQALEGIGLHKDRSNVLMVATDGLFGLEDLEFPKPRDTGTQATGKPLGGWEKKVITKGVFLARPGIYFPMSPTQEEMKDVRGRGVGKGTILEHWAKIVKSYETHGIDKTVQVSNVSRFCGGKTSISRSGNSVDGYRYTRANGKGSKPAYGQWIKRPVEMSFHPMPKRECVNKDGSTLKLRIMPKHIESTPYDKASRSIEAMYLALATQELIEQPDGDYSDWAAEPPAHR